MGNKETLRHFVDNFKIKYPRQFEDIDVKSIDFHLNTTSEPELILEIISENYSKFLLIIRTILIGAYNQELYKKEADSVYAMRLKNKNSNSRIYCREIKGGENERKKIVMSVGLKNKTTQKNNNAINQIIEGIKTDTYIFNNEK